LAFAAVNAVDRSGWSACIATDCLQPGAATPGACIGVLRVPSLGTDWARPIIVGGGTGTGGTGAVWLAGTTAPGQTGNFVVAGRRVGGGQPFAGVEGLAAGDQVIVETASQIYTYVIEVAPRTLTTTANDSWVLDPVPGNADVAPQQALLTLVLRQDLWPTRDRSIGVAVLRQTVDK
jgi:sortase A